MTTPEPDEPTLDVLFPENGDAILLLRSSRMFEGEDGLLVPGALIDKAMAVQFANLLMSWAIGMIGKPEDYE